MGEGCAINKVIDEIGSAPADDSSRWRIALESAEAGVWYYDLERGNETASDHWYVMRGLDPVRDFETGYKFWFDRLHPDDVEHMQQFIARMNNGELPDLSAEYRERHADGHWIWILCRGKTIFGDDGKPARFVGTDTDITALKTADFELRQMSQRFEFAIANSKIGVWEFEPKTNRIWWDQTTCKLFGVRGDEKQVPEMWLQRLHPDDRERARALATEAMKKTSGYDMDYRIIWPDGSVRHIRSRSAYMQSADGPKQIGLNWDVTEDYARAEELETARLLAEQRNEELDAARLQMEYSALHDALTGLPNRRQLDKKLGSLKPGRSRIAILHIDLDLFKEINDTLGHLAGDVTLQRAANILRDSAPKRALVSRAGGDEFIIIIEQAPDDEALAKLADEIISKMQEPLNYGGQECTFGASIGIAVATGGTSSRALLHNADMALYEAKETGRNRHCFFTAEMAQQAAEKKTCADDILAGLTRNEFFPVYQLQFEAKTLDVVGVEVLARWQHPLRGVLLPGEFMDVADDIGAVSRIDAIVFARAFSDFRAWRESGLDLGRVALNMSAKSLLEQSVLDVVRGHGLGDARVAIDLQESRALDNAAGREQLASLRAAGIGIEVADFGTSHSSVAGLMSLRPERFKIDPRLLKDIVVSVEQRRLATSIIGIGKALGIEVVAAGVETADQVKVLRRLDCDVLQGYGLAVPMTAAALVEFVSAGNWRKVA